jgi:hypothetical protein
MSSLLAQQARQAGRLDPLEGGAKRLGNELIFRHFSNILPRFLSAARVES